MQKRDIISTALTAIGAVLGAVMAFTGRPVFGTALCLILTTTLVVDGLTAGNERRRRASTAEQSATR